jgi:CheY-like chemotaxis protein
MRVGDQAEVPSDRVLVIAPNPDFRRSLAFALEAEGYVVTSHANIPGNDASRGYDCVVLDHKAANGPRDSIISFCRTSNPVLLLAGSPQPWLASEVSRVVQTPLSGDMLSVAIRSALDSSASRPPTK